ncbi:MAG: hypothetical protein AB7G75_02080 [Candidatus Binatia bacterium]
MPQKNSRTYCTKLSVRAICVLALTGLILVWGKSEALAQHCKHVRGYFINQVLIPTGTDNCNSPLGSCVKGQAIGVLKGNFLSTITSFTPAAQILPSLVGTPVETVFFVTADLVLHTKNGELHLTETAVSNQDPSQGDLGDVVTVMGGTDHWDGATGRLRVWGNLSPTISDVTYEGEVCLP